MDTADIIGCIWLVGAVIAWPIIARGLYRHRSEEFPTVPRDTIDELVATGIAFLSALIWPVVVAGLVFRALVFGPIRPKETT